MSFPAPKDVEPQVKKFEKEILKISIHVHAKNSAQWDGVSKNKVVIKISPMLVFLPWGSGVKIL